MRLMNFVYPAAFVRDEDGALIVSFRDLPEAHTSGRDLPDAMAEAVDCLDEAIAGRVVREEPIPTPSARRGNERLIALPPHTAAQAALALAMRDAGITKSELARRLGCDVREARRLLDPAHPSKINRIAAAMRALGAEYVSGWRKIA
jgi:antitoxin HicB